MHVIEVNSLRNIAKISQEVNSIAMQTEGKSGKGQQKVMWADEIKFARIT